MFFFWILIIAIVSIIWSFVSFRREKNRHEMEKAKKEIAKGRVIYYSSSDDSSS